MQAKLYNQTGESAGTVELNPKIFGLEKVSKDLIHQVVVGLMSSKRGSVAHSKTRGEVRGGGKKPWQQKGTGRARVGSIRSPLWRGGGITFGPRSARNWELKINKKAKTQVLLAVLTDKAKTGQLVVVEDLKLSAPKTKELASKIKNLQALFPVLGRKLTLVAPDSEHELARAVKNLPNVNLQTPASLDIVKLLSVPGLVVVKDALPLIEKMYLKTKD